MSDTLALWPWLEANATLLGLLFGALGLLGALTRYSVGATLAEFTDLRDRAGAIARHQSGWAENYFNAINQLVVWATCFFGQRWSLRSFARCLQIAAVYPVLALLIGWFFYDVGEVGRLDLLTEGYEIWDRLWRLSIMLGCWTAGAWIARKIKLSAWLGGIFSGSGPIFGPLYFDNHWEKLRSIFCWVIELAVFYVAFMFVAVFFSLPSFAVADGPDAMFPFAIGMMLILGFPLFGAMLFLIFMAFSVGDSGDMVSPTILLLFFLVLPFLNAMADWISIAVTRSFLAHIAKRGREADKPGLGLILWDLFLDLVAAALCLGGLIGAIIVALEVWAALVPGALLFDWRAYWADIRANPGHGTMLYLMCLTTLIPTILHVIAGLGAALSHKNRLMLRVADRFADLGQGTPSARDLNRARRDLYGAYLWGYGCATAAVIVPVAAVAAWVF